MKWNDNDALRQRERMKLSTVTLVPCEESHMTFGYTKSIERGQTDLLVSLVGEIGEVASAAGNIAAHSP